MPPGKKKQASNAKKLAKSLSEDKARAGIRRTRKNPVRTKPGGDTGRAVADERELSALARLMGALSEEKIRFVLIGMSAAIVQGVPGSTVDVDFWIDLPPRQYMQAANVAMATGAKMIRNTVMELADQTLVNFVYEVTGLGSFSNELRKVKKVKFQGLQVSVLPLESIRKSKLAIGRSKDLTHVQQIEDTLKLRKAERKKKK